MFNIQGGIQQNREEISDCFLPSQLYCIIYIFLFYFILLTSCENLQGNVPRATTFNKNIELN